MNQIKAHKSTSSNRANTSKHSRSHSSDSSRTWRWKSPIWSFKCEKAKKCRGHHTVESSFQLLHGSSSRWSLILHLAMTMKKYQCIYFIFNSWNSRCNSRESRLRLQWWKYRSDMQESDRKYCWVPILFNLLFERLQQ